MKVSSDDRGVSSKQACEDNELSSNNADLDKTYDSCSPYCDKPCQIHFNQDETASDENDDTTKLKEQGQENGACSGIEVYQDSSEVEIEVSEVEIEVTDANADKITTTIEEETKLENTLADLTEDPGPSPCTPPREVIFRTTHSPIKFDISPRKSVKERLGKRSWTPRWEAVTHQGARYRDETQRRTPVKDRLGQRTRSSWRCNPPKSLGQKFTPQTMESRPNGKPLVSRTS